jgi:GAF domain-containing protein
VLVLMSFIRRWDLDPGSVDKTAVEFLFLLGLVAAVGLPLLVYIPGSRRRRTQIVELRDFTDCLIDSAMTDPQRLVVVDFLLAITQREEVKAELTRIAMGAKERFHTAYAEVNFLNGDGDLFVAGDSMAPLPHARQDSYCRLTLAGRPVVIKDSLTNLMLADNPHVEVVRTYLGIPLVVRDEVVGALCVYDSEPREWTDEDERELAAMAADVERTLVAAGS